MSANARRELDDEGGEVDERDRHRRNIQSDHGQVPATKRSRPNEEKVEKEMIDHFSFDPSPEVKDRDKDEGSSRLDNLYASFLPSSDYYERSYMHRDVLSHILVTQTDFLITASQDGHLKFWKILTAEYLKQQQQTATKYELAKNSDKDKDNDHASNFLNGPIEFVKHFRAHLGTGLLDAERHLHCFLCLSLQVQS